MLFKHMISGFQMLFVAFGATVLVPLLTGLDPAMALLGAGIGTLIFQWITGFQIPIFLGSSFAFIVPIAVSIQTWGISGTLFALSMVSVAYFIMALLVKWKGSKIIHQIFPPVVIGPIIMVIGLSVAPVAVQMSMGIVNGQQVIPHHSALFLAGISLFATVMTSVYAKGLLKVAPILVGILVGYTASCFMGFVSFSALISSPWFDIPVWQAPRVEWSAVWFMLPVALAPMIEHIGGIMAIGQVSGKDFAHQPGLHRTLFGDGIGVLAAGLLGGPPVTTYAEVTGAVMLTKNTEAKVMVWAALWAIVLAFFAKFNALLQSIPSPVMGGVMLLLFGSIAGLGLRTLILAKVDLMIPRNLTIVALTLTTGFGGMKAFGLSGVGFASLFAVIVHMLFPKETEEINDNMEHQ
jgi:uracil permease